MQVFRPDDVDLATAPADPAFAGPTGSDAPMTRSAASIQSTDGGFRTGVWESGPGTTDYTHPTDEWAYILEGEASVTAAGRTHELRPGDVFFTPAGERMTWVVPTHIRKVWVHRRTPLPGRLRRKIAKVLGRTT